MGSKTSRRQLKFDRNPIEAIRDSGVTVAKTTANELKLEAQRDANLAWRQLLGINNEEKSDSKAQTKNNTHGQGDLNEGEELVLTKKEKNNEISPAINYFAEILHGEKRFSNENSRELNAKIEELRIEILKLSKSSKELEVVVRDVSIETVGPNPGKYHLNFFEWVLATIQTARIRVEESANWLTLVSTKSQKKSYWGSVKKHGTSFMLSGERVVAQQTG